MDRKIRKIESQVLDILPLPPLSLSLSLSLALWSLCEPIGVSQDGQTRHLSSLRFFVTIHPCAKYVAVTVATQPEVMHLKYLCTHDRAHIQLFWNRSCLPFSLPMVHVFILLTLCTVHVYMLYYVCTFAVWLLIEQHAHR